VCMHAEGPSLHHLLARRHHPLHAETKRLVAPHRTRRRTPSACTRADSTTRAFDARPSHTRVQRATRPPRTHSSSHATHFIFPRLSESHGVRTSVGACHVHPSSCGTSLGVCARHSFARTCSHLSPTTRTLGGLLTSPMSGAGPRKDEVACLRLEAAAPTSEQWSASGTHLRLIVAAQYRHGLVWSSAQHRHGVSVVEVLSGRCAMMSHGVTEA
jgi:hypothetical protein